ncbi:S-layer homology domain-containing protein [Peptococcaceae bacterium]|nr:S-layer homology domain-containing protein [Peptococcaceae bacterium]
MKGDNKFTPDASVTRAQLTALLVKLLKLQEDSTSIPFKDVPSNAWYAKAIGAAVKAGLIAGYSKDVFAPDDEITKVKTYGSLISFKRLL